MPQIHNGRFAAEIEGDFVVFLIGMRINQLWAVHKWMPVSRAMPRMLSELFRQPKLGLLEARSYLSGRTVMVAQYWRSFDHLHAYAHARDKAHLPAWAEFNRLVGGNGAVGIFHETYLVPARSYEAIYVNMPRIGLAKAGQIVSATGARESARDRLKRVTTEADKQP